MKRFLEHIRVLDLSRLIPGAQCSQLLADLGARVLKVEEPGRGDYIRQINPHVFAALNRNKMSMTLNLKQPGGKEILLRLLRNHDVLLETFRPGVMERLGLGYEKVRGINDEIIYCSLSGYGQNGPYRLKSGHDINYLAISGMLGLTVDQGQLPVALPIPLADLAGGIMASHAILAALLARNNSGKGCYVDVAMLDAALSLMSVRLAVGLGKGKTGRRDLIRGGAYDAYRTRDDKFITLGIIEDKFWLNLSRAIGRDDMVRDPRFLTDQLRSQNRKEVRETLEPILMERDLEEWMTIFDQEDVPAAPVNQLDRVGADPQVAHRKLMFDYPAIFAGQEELEDRLAPEMGRDTHQVLTDLGIGEDEIRSFRSSGVI
jgi:alpha-methylacyl-CoA racemase